MIGCFNKSKLKNDKLNLYNYYFAIPCIIWLISGGLLILIFNEQTLFYAINNNYSHFLDVFMHYASIMGEGEIIVPVLLSLFIFKKFRNFKYFFSALLCNILPFFLQQILKTWIDAPRPMVNYENPLWHIHFLPQWDRLHARSLPSGHSAGAFSFFCYLALLLPNKYKIFGLLLFVLAMLVSYSRIYLAAHYFLDVYCGSLLGWIFTTVIFGILNKYKFNP